MEVMLVWKVYHLSLHWKSNAALKEQAEHGYPASVTLAQIIAESGYGR